MPLFRKKNVANISTRAALPAPVANLLRESWWLLLVVLLGYLILVLTSYHRSDPGWSHSATETVIHNRGGTFGAWVADVLLYCFGFSAWWWIVFCLAAILWGYRRIDRVTESSKPLVFLACLGFALIILSSASLEALRLHSMTVSLPHVPGGILGLSLGGWLMKSFGFSGATLLLFATMGLGISLFTGLSWLNVMENIGTAIEWGIEKIHAAFQAAQDRKIGRETKKMREQKVSEAKKKQDDKAPLIIETPQVDVPIAKKLEREKKELEKQQILEAKQAAQPLLFAEEDLPPAPVAQSKKTNPSIAAFGDGSLPSLGLLAPAPVAQETISKETLEFTSQLIERKLADFNVEVKVVAAYPGPVITRYEIEPAVGVKGSQIVNLMKDLARALGLVSIRVVETIPGKTYMGLELPNPTRQMIRLSEIMSSEAYHSMASKLTLVLGKDITGKPIVTDLAKAPHMLVAGTTGSGKSVGVNAMILSLVYKATPDEVRFIMIDPKMLELSIYDGIPHLLAPVVTDMKLAANALNWCVAEMEKRYRLLSALGVRNLAGYNQKVKDAEKAGKKLTNPFTLTPDDPEPLEHLPFIVVVVDEFADLMMVAGKKIEELIARLAQKARAAGIHLILATQRPSVDVITGLIKANIPTRLAFQVSSKIDSRTILDQMGAEALLGQGDMLFLPPGSGYPLRVHGAFVADDEVHRVVDSLKEMGEPQYIEGILNGGFDAESAGNTSLGGDGNSTEDTDPLYDEAVAFVMKSRRASISSVQRQLRIGYNRAARLIEQMESAGLVSSMESNGNRTVLAPASE